MTEIQYTLRLQDLIFFNDNQFCKTEAAKKTLRRHQTTIPAALSIIVLFVWFYYQDTLTAMWLGVACVVWAFLAPWMIRWNAKKRAMALYTPDVLERVLGSYTLKVEDDNLLEIGKAGESRIAWKDVLRIEPAKNYAFIFVSADSAIIVPRKTITQGDLLTFYKDVEAHIDQAS